MSTAAVLEARSAPLSVYITQSLKEALHAEADKRGISLSRVVQILLAEKLKLKGDWLAGRERGQGRKPSERVVLTEAFKTAILSSRKTRQNLARDAGLNVAALTFLLRGSEVTLTPQTKERLARVAKAIQYEGDLVANHRG